MNAYRCLILLRARLTASSHPPCIILVLSYYSGQLLFTDQKSKVPIKYQEANCLCGPGSTFYYVNEVANKVANKEPIFALTQHQTHPKNNIAMFLEPNLPSLEALGLLICRYRARRGLYNGKELFSDYWVRESGKWYQYHTEDGIPSSFSTQDDGTLLQIEDDDDDDSDFELPKVKKERTSKKKSPPVEETSNSRVAEWLPPVGSMVSVHLIYISVPVPYLFLTTPFLHPSLTVSYNMG